MPNHATLLLAAAMLASHASMVAAFAPPASFALHLRCPAATALSGRCVLPRVSLLDQEAALIELLSVQPPKVGPEHDTNVPSQPSTRRKVKPELETRVPSQIMTRPGSPELWHALSCGIAAARNRGHAIRPVRDGSRLPFSSPIDLPRSGSARLFFRRPHMKIRVRCLPWCHLACASEFDGPGLECKSTNRADRDLTVH